MGRFMTPDWSAAPMGVPYADFGNPQSLNLYGYVKNNPLSLTDPDGHCCGLDDAINFVVGVPNAYSSDNLGGAGRQSQSTFEGKIGAAVGDTIATAQGAAEFTVGGTGVASGIALSATGEGAIVGVPLVAASAVVAANGAIVATQGAGHLGATFRAAIAPTSL
jgi:hypothetical protein